MAGRKKEILWLFVLLLASVITVCSTGIISLPPQTQISDQVDVIHGVSVKDPYRWLENWEDPAVQDWSRQQNLYARNHLDQLFSVNEIDSRIETLLNSSSESYYSLDWHAGRLFALKQQPPLDQPLLVVMKSVEDSNTEKVILDLNQFDPDGTTSIDWYVPSPDGQFVAASLSRGGSEAGDLHIIEVDTGKLSDIVIQGVNGGTAGGDIAWTPDGKGFYYTRYPRKGERPLEDLNFYQEVWFHKFHSLEKNDEYIFGRDLPKIAENRVEVDSETGTLLISMQNGDSGQFAHYLRLPGDEWDQITGYEDQVVEAFFGPNGTILMVSTLDAPRGKIISIPLKNPKLEKTRVVVPESEDTIVSIFYYKTKIAVTEKRLFVTYQLGGPTTVRAYDLDGNIEKSPELLPISSVYEIEALDGDSILVNNSSYLEPAVWFQFDTDNGQTKRTPLAVESPVDFSDTEVVREFAASPDGTRIPVNIIRLKGLDLDGNNPTLLYGYGGFNLSRTPGFSSVTRIWIEQEESMLSRTFGEEVSLVRNGMRQVA